MIMDKLILENQLAIMQYLMMTGLTHDANLRKQVKATQERLEQDDAKRE